MIGPLRNVLSREQSRNHVRCSSLSSAHPGHEQRLAEHARRIRSATCECGSGRPYGDCCVGNDQRQSSAGISYSLPASVHPDERARCEIEDRLRLRAFATFYKAGHQEHDPLVRFVRALVASAGPIRQPDRAVIRRNL